MNCGIFIKSNSHHTLAGTQVYLQAKTVSSLFCESIFHLMCICRVPSKCQRLCLCCPCGMSTPPFMNKSSGRGVNSLAQVSDVRGGSKLLHGMLEEWRAKRKLASCSLQSEGVYRVLLIPCPRPHYQPVPALMLIFLLYLPPRAGFSASASPAPSLCLGETGLGHHHAFLKRFLAGSPDSQNRFLPEPFLPFSLPSVSPGTGWVILMALAAGGFWRFVLQEMSAVFLRLWLKHLNFPTMIYYWADFFFPPFFLPLVCWDLRKVIKIRQMGSLVGVDQHGWVPTPLKVRKTRGSTKLLLEKNLHKNRVPIPTSTICSSLLGTNWMWYPLTTERVSYVVWPMQSTISEVGGLIHKWLIILIFNMTVTRLSDENIGSWSPYFRYLEF